MAVAEAVLSVVEGEGLLAQVDTVGTFLKEGLLRLMEQHTCIGDVRGVGLLVGVDFVKNRESKEGDGELASSVAQKCVGVMLLCWESALIFSQYVLATLCIQPI